MNLRNPEAKRRLERAVRMVRAGYKITAAAKTYHVSEKAIRKTLK